MSAAKPSRAGGAFLLERRVGTACGVSVEVWSSAATGTGSLVLLPTAEGFTVLVPDVAEDLSFLVLMGGTVLRAIEVVGPLLTGDHFRQRDAAPFDAVELLAFLDKRHERTPLDVL